MSEFSVEVTRADLQAFEQTLELWMRHSGKSAPEVIRQQARLIAVNLAYSTQPYGFDSSARQQGLSATARDIARVYVPVTKIFATIALRQPDAAEGFLAAVRKGDVAHAREIMRAFGLGGIADVPFGKFDPAVHNQLRLGNRRGRINSRTKPRLLVTDPAALSRYQKREAGKVGYAKSAFATCADQLGGARGIPHWAKRCRAPAVVLDHTGDWNSPHVVMRSLVPFADVVLPAAARQDALEKQRGKMQTAIRLSVERAGRRSRAVA